MSYSDRFFKLLNFIHKFNSHVPILLILLHFLIVKYIQLGSYNRYYFGTIEVLAICFTITHMNSLAQYPSLGVLINCLYISFSLFNNLLITGTLCLFLSNGKPFDISDIVLTILFVCGMVSNFLFTMLDNKLLGVAQVYGNNVDTLRLPVSDTIVVIQDGNDQNGNKGKDLVVESLNDTDVVKLSESVEEFSNYIKGSVESSNTDNLIVDGYIS